MQNEYYKLSPEQIVNDISKHGMQDKIQILGKEYIIYPDVYPSDKFRTTNFLLKSIKHLIPNATICDMGCGMGIVGLYALQNGAKKVVQADINPEAVENAKANKTLYRYNDDKLQVIKSDCFEAIPPQKFDLIIFNIPFHSNGHEMRSSLDYAFYDPEFKSTKKFLLQARSFMHSNTKIIIAFSNKGDVKSLEDLFTSLYYNWNLWRTSNTDSLFDNRLYMLKK